MSRILHAVEEFPSDHIPQSVDLRCSIEELHRTLRENYYTRQSFPTRREALRAARSRHQVSQQEEIKDGILDAEEAIEAEEVMGMDEEFYQDFDEYGDYY